MWQRLAVLLGQICAVSLVASATSVGGTVNPPVVEVDIGRLLGALCGGEQARKTAPFLRGSFVMVPFRCSETDASCVEQSDSCAIGQRHSVYSY